MLLGKIAANSETPGEIQFHTTDGNAHWYEALQTQISLWNMTAIH